MRKKNKFGSSSNKNIKDDCNDCLAIDGFGVAMESIWKLRTEARERGSVSPDSIERELELVFHVIMLLGEVANENARQGIEQVKKHLYGEAYKSKKKKNGKLELVHSHQ
jgi:spore coat polysaccharide biosynthesis predicted glycosyltransferase SpsG